MTGLDTRDSIHVFWGESKTSGYILITDQKIRQIGPSADNSTEDGFYQARHLFLCYFSVPGKLSRVSLTQVYRKSCEIVILREST